MRVRPTGWVAAVILISFGVDARAADVVFPPDAGVVNVRDLGAKGDGVTDDTAVIQKALADHPNQGAIIYLPAGTYLISDTLRWPKGDRGGWEEKNTILQGQGRDKTILKLKDACAGFGDPKKVKGMIWTGKAPAQRFRNAVRDMTFDVGARNPGAAGMQFMANNQGCVRDVLIRAPDGSGAIGLDLGYTDEQGPCLIKRVEVVGFDTGVRTRHAVDSVVFEHLTLRGQRRIGFSNDGQCVSVRGLKSANAVTAVENKGAGVLAMIDSELTAAGTAPGTPAVVNDAAMMLRNVRTPGYATAVGGKSPPLPAPAGAPLLSDPLLKLFDGPAAPLNLPVKETPEVPWDPPADWVSPLAFGGKPDDSRDDSAAIQAAIDSGKTTIYLPRGSWHVERPVVIRGNVRRIVGCEAHVELVASKMKGKTGFTMAEQGAPVVVFERVGGGYLDSPMLANATTRTLVISSCCNVAANFSGGGENFVEDVCSNPFTNWTIGRGTTVWGRQWNVENEGTHITNDGGTVWILGYKTERGGTLLWTKNGGRSEVVGGFCYSTSGDMTVPMFIVEDAALSVTFGEACFSGKPYTTVVRETRGGVTRDLRKGEAPGRLNGSVLPLYVSGSDAR
jgi:hypothetical protein